VLGFGQSDQPDPQEVFANLGMDSLTAVELRNRLQSSLDCQLSATMAFDYPNVGALVDYLEGRMFKNQADAAKSASVERPNGTASTRAEVVTLTQDEVESEIAAELSLIQSLLSDNS
jgi:acyl carrier protein